ncbi:hypothetical protein MYO4S_00263 [Serratia phage 4S]|nr:hypothetical protein MYO4S_00263 [Serratia phage 4S]
MSKAYSTFAAAVCIMFFIAVVVMASLTANESIKTDVIRLCMIKTQEMQNAYEVIDGRCEEVK